MRGNVAKMGRAFGALVLAGWCASGVMAQTYPEKPIKLMLGFGPGGSTDVVARLMTQRLSPALGQPLVVDYRPGAGSAVAADVMAKSPADGYTILLMASAHATLGAMMKSLPYDTVNDFSWLSTLTAYPLTISVSPATSITSMASLIEQAKKAPGKLSYSSAGIGSAHHLVGEWINAEAGIEIVHVPFKGGGPALTEVIAGRVEVMIEASPAALPQIRGGKVRGIAVTSRRPLPNLPDLPSISDTLPGIEYESWQGLATAPRTPAPIVNRLNAEIRKALALPEVQKQFADLGGAAAASSPEEFRARVERDVVRLRAVVDKRKIERM